jgi:hypothetical protein
LLLSLAALLPHAYCASATMRFQSFLMKRAALADRPLRHVTLVSID